MALRLFRIPRPKSFLCVMSLQTGTSLITLSLLLNKISGLYGLLALLTGYHLSPVQLSMYIYSLAVLALTVLLFPHIRKQTPLHCLGLAWVYFFDTLINAAYTAAFGVTWFLVVSQHYHNAPKSGPGSTIEDTAGFTNPTYNVSSVHIPGNVLSPGQDSGITADPASVPAGIATDPINGTPSLSNGVRQPESFESIIMISVLWVVRFYFSLIMFAFARQALRHKLLNASQPRYNQLPTHSRATSVATVASAADIDREPFLPHTPEGQGWQGTLGRAMISVFRNYWLGTDSSDEEDASWMSGFGRGLHTRNNLSISGISERERRRRSGTGPPKPSQSVLQAASLMQPVHGENETAGVNLQDFHESR
ncbi:Inositolphosphorylceramide synthase subunit Kei1-domain-containing protein [Talaromyces proteolyticus]|uniref:Inositolphosphorylceramide synthase subunit Kei1-domain-containing protein n=1 Tax=Talaromyces proteolyticus TaxID=1131652 RepID=A0AAD4KU22_9EURO|nr:Inositolphosphorylceramide synthase subunit Kei1-domain-containing protein [Talaromyces proteolyticus]KAH8696566.1 Inositolphosphorylceramide synthase subunit Kei1-domain-containing protein [Talaromyces proteolyticus]